MLDGRPGAARDRWGSKGTFDAEDQGQPCAGWWDPRAVSSAVHPERGHDAAVGDGDQSVRNTVSKTGTCQSAGGDARSMALARRPDPVRGEPVRWGHDRVGAESTRRARWCRTSRPPTRAIRTPVLGVDSLAVDSSNKFLTWVPGRTIAEGWHLQGWPSAPARSPRNWMVNQNFMQALAVAGNSRVVAMSGSSITAAPGTLQVLKRKEPEALAGQGHSSGGAGCFGREPVRVRGTAGACHQHRRWRVLVDPDQVTAGGRCDGPRTR